MKRWGIRSPSHESSITAAHCAAVSLQAVAHCWQCSSGISKQIFIQAKQISRQSCKAWSLKLLFITSSNVVLWHTSAHSRHIRIQSACSLMAASCRHVPAHDEQCLAHCVMVWIKASWFILMFTSYLRNFFAMFKKRRGMMLDDLSRLTKINA